MVTAPLALCMQLLKALSASRMLHRPLSSAEYPFDQKGLKSDVEVRAKPARDQMGVLERFLEKLVSEAKAEFL